MAQITISITKRVVFRDSTQEFSNVYCYANASPAGLDPDFPQGSDLIDEVANVEKGIHGTSVTFIRGRLWSSGGTPAENKMLTDKVLTGLGTAVTNTSMDKERAVLIQWGAGDDSRGRKVYLRKWYHLCASIGGVGATAGQLANETQLTSAQRNAVATSVDALTRIGSVEEWGLVADSGRERDGTAPTCHKYLEHHQLGDQWRQG